MTRTILEEIRRDLQANVLDRLRMRATGHYPVDGEYVLKSPVSYLIGIPPGSAGDDEPELSAPAVVVTFGKKTMEAQDSSIEILLHGVVYSPGLTIPAGEEKQFTSGYEGYWDLINLLDSLAAYLRRESVLAEKYELISPVEVQLEEEQPWPYWAGSVRFTVQIPDYPSARYTSLIN